MDVQFGNRSYNVQPQRIGRIRRRLGAAINLVQTAAGGDTPDGVGTLLYEGLRVFVPDIAPEWEIAGYMTAEDYERRDEDGFEEQPYEAERDGSPLTIEIEQMINAIFTVNGGDRLAKLLGKFVDENTIKRQVRIWQATQATQGASKRLQSLQPPSGESVPTSSSATSPISGPIAA